MIIYALCDTLLYQLRCIKSQVIHPLWTMNSYLQTVAGGAITGNNLQQV